MLMLMMSARSAARHAPFFVLPLLATLAAGCGRDSPQADSTVKVEKGKDATESVSKQRVLPGVSKKDPGPKQRVSSGPG